MRHEPTQAERRLWQALRADRLDGAKFRRQVVIGQAVADFACRTPTKLVVEVDGASHDLTFAADADRTRYLESRGYRVIRFSNADVMRNLDGVVLAIREALQTPPLPDPLP